MPFSHVSSPSRAEQQALSTAATLVSSISVGHGPISTLKWPVSAPKPLPTSPATTSSSTASAVQPWSTIDLTMLRSEGTSLRRRHFSLKAWKLLTASAPMSVVIRPLHSS